MQVLERMTINKNSKIVVLAEGFSAEKEISIRSAKNTSNLLIEAGFINSKCLYVSNKEDLKKIIDLRLESEIDLAVLMTHGTHGEDGALQGLLEMLEIKYTGSKLKASANCMDKLSTKQILKSEGLKVFPNLNLKQLKTDTSLFPIMLKARADGSSVGIEKIESLAELENKLNTEAGLKEEIESQQIFIEPFTAGIELTASIIPYDEVLYQEIGIDLTKFKANKNINIDADLVSLALLRLVPENDFYDYEAKYTAGMTKFELPAQIPESLSQRIHEIALNAYQALECSGFARVDFIISGDLEQEAEINILEINTLPGMTDTSDLPAQAKASNIASKQLVEILVRTAQ